MIDNVAHGGRQTSARISQVGSAWMSCQWHRPPCLAVCDSPRSVWQHRPSGVTIAESTLIADKRRLFVHTVALFLFNLSFSISSPTEPKHHIKWFAELPSNCGKLLLHLQTYNYHSSTPKIDDWMPSLLQLYWILDSYLHPVTSDATHSVDHPAWTKFDDGMSVFVL